MIIQVIKRVTVAFTRRRAFRRSSTPGRDHDHQRACGAITVAALGAQESAGSGIKAEIIQISMRLMNPRNTDDRVPAEYACTDWKRRSPLMKFGIANALRRHLNSWAAHRGATTNGQGLSGQKWPKAALGGSKVTFQLDDSSSG